MKIKRDVDHVVVQEIRSMHDYGHGVSWIRGPLLGRGTYGRVHKATLRTNYPSSSSKCNNNNSLPSVMAVKSAERSVSSTLMVEKEVLTNLKGCPYVIQCFGGETTMGYNGDLAYNVLLEYGSGGSLSDRIKKSGFLSEQEVKAHTKSILRGLEHIHGKGYVHCDLKPGNVLLVKNRAKIGDFGLAKKKSSDSLPSCVKGTTMYLSPEAVMDCVQEAPADVWALGCTVLQMLTGKRPWEGEKDEILGKISAENELPSNINSKEVSDDARHFLMCCFERESTRRWTAEKLLRHPFLDGLGDDDDDDDDAIESDHYVMVDDSDEEEFSFDQLLLDESFSSSSDINALVQGFAGLSTRNYYPAAIAAGM